MAWVRWSYKSAGELRFDSHRISSTAGVQQGDPLGPMLFSLVILELIDEIGLLEGLHLSLWHLDDGTFSGTRKSFKVVAILDVERSEFWSVSKSSKMRDILAFWKSKLFLKLIQMSDEFTLLLMVLNNWDFPLLVQMISLSSILVVVWIRF